MSQTRASRSATKKVLEANLIPVNVTAEEAAAAAKDKADKALEDGEVLTFSKDTTLSKQIYDFVRPGAGENLSDEARPLFEAGKAAGEFYGSVSKKERNSGVGKRALQEHENFQRALKHIEAVEAENKKLKANTVITIEGDEALKAVLEVPTADRAEKTAQQRRVIAEQIALLTDPSAKHAAANEGEEERVARLEASLDKAKAAVAAAVEKTPDKPELVLALEERVAAISEALKKAKDDAALTGVQAGGEGLQKEAEKGLEANAAKKQRTRSAEAEASDLVTQAALGAEMQQTPKAHHPSSGEPNIADPDELAAALEADAVKSKPSRGKGSGKKGLVPRDEAQSLAWKEARAKTRKENAKAKADEQERLRKFEQDHLDSDIGKLVTEHAAAMKVTEDKLEKAQDLLERTSSKKKEFNMAKKALESENASLKRKLAEIEGVSDEAGEAPVSDNAGEAPVSDEAAQASVSDEAAQASVSDEAAQLKIRRLEYEIVSLNRLYRNCFKVVQKTADKGGDLDAEAIITIFKAETAKNREALPMPEDLKAVVYVEPEDPTKKKKRKRADSDEASTA
jgi:hypothetical protein